MILALINQKGGVGKTTSAINLGAALAENEHRVLVVDLDPQGSATTHAGIDLAADALTVWTALKANLASDDIPDPLGLPVDDEPPAIGLADIICQAAHDEFWVAPASQSLTNAEMALNAADFRRERRIGELLAPILSQYDDILLDCQPAVGMLTVNALAAADAVIIPTPPAYLDMVGLRSLLKVVARVKRDVNYTLTVAGVLITRMDRRRGMERDVEENIRQALTNHYRVFTTIIPDNAAIQKAAAARRSVLFYETRSSGAQAYRALAKELMGLQSPATSTDEE